MSKFITKVEKPKTSILGAIRSDNTGKGRFDLIPPSFYHRCASIWDDNFLIEEDTTIDTLINEALRNIQQIPIASPQEDYLAIAACCLLEAIQIDETKKSYAPIYCWKKNIGYALLAPQGLRRLALVYERGAAMRGERNWEKGFEIGRCIDSSLRHLSQYLDGDREEDHLSQALWNLAAAMHCEEMIFCWLLPKSLDNRPVYRKTRRP